MLGRGCVMRRRRGSHRRPTLRHLLVVKDEIYVFVSDFHNRKGKHDAVCFLFSLKLFRNKIFFYQHYIQGGICHLGHRIKNFDHTV